MAGFAATGAGPGAEPDAGNYPLLIQAAIAGRGVALGWRSLIDDLLRDGQLAALAAPATTERGYFLVRPQGCAASQGLDSLCGWIVRDCTLAQRP